MGKEADEGRRENTRAASAAGTGRVEHRGVAAISVGPLKEQFRGRRAEHPERGWKLAQAEDGGVGAGEVPLARPV